MTLWTESEWEMNAQVPTIGRDGSDGLDAIVGDGDGDGDGDGEINEDDDKGSWVEVEVGKYELHIHLHHFHHYWRQDSHSRITSTIGMITLINI